MLSNVLKIILETNMIVLMMQNEKQNCDKKCFSTNKMHFSQIRAYSSLRSIYTCPQLIIITQNHIKNQNCVQQQESTSIFQQASQLIVQQFSDNIEKSIMHQPSLNKSININFDDEHFVEGLKIQNKKYCHNYRLEVQNRQHDQKQLTICNKYRQCNQNEIATVTQIRLKNRVIRIFDTFEALLSAIGKKTQDNLLKEESKNHNIEFINQKNCLISSSQENLDLINNDINITRKILKIFKKWIFNYAPKQLKLDKLLTKIIRDCKNLPTYDLLKTMAKDNGLRKSFLTFYSTESQEYFDKIAGIHKQTFADILLQWRDFFLIYEKQDEALKQSSKNESTNSPVKTQNKKNNQIVPES